MGRCLKLKMPDGRLIFSIEDFSLIDRRHFEPGTLDPNSTERLINFNDAVTGIEFVTE